MIDLIPFPDDFLQSIEKAEVISVACIDTGSDGGNALRTVEDPGAADPLFIIEAIPVGKTIDSLGATRRHPHFFATDGDGYIEIYGEDERFGIDSRYRVTHRPMRLTTRDQRIIKWAIRRFVKAI